MPFLESIKNKFSSKENKKENQDPLLIKINSVLNDFKYSVEDKNKFSEKDNLILEEAKATLKEMDSANNVDGSIAAKFSRLDLSKEDKVKFRMGIQDVISTLTQKKNAESISNKDAENKNLVAKLKAEGKVVEFDGGNDRLNSRDRYETYEKDGKIYFNTKDGKQVVNPKGELVYEKAVIQENFNETDKEDLKEKESQYRTAA
jgi:rhamnose utilization protein RhaD (predicted bifunctional aldolase and dehydrogenase)